MSFSFNWKAFAHEEAFQAQIRDLLTNALNKNKPRILEGNIRVLNLDWGTQAPSLEMLEIGDVAADRFRGILKFSYTGSASITIAAQVQANLLNVYAAAAPNTFVMPQFVGSPVSFTIPLHLSLSEIRLQGIVILVFSKAKGLTLVFRNDPLQHIKVSSTFDTLPGIPSILQSQIENQIRGLFREELPSVLYRLSLRYTPNGGEALAPPVIEPRKSVSFAEIDKEKKVSPVSLRHVEGLCASRRTLAVSSPIIPWALVRPELHRLEVQPRGAQLNWLGNAMFDQVHSHASHVASRSNHRHKRRVIKLRSRESSVEPEPAVVTEPMLIADTTPIEPEPIVVASTSTGAVSSVRQPRLVADTKRVLGEPLLVRRAPRVQVPLFGLKPQVVDYSSRRGSRIPVSIPLFDPEELPPAYVA